MKSGRYIIRLMHICLSNISGNELSIKVQSEWFVLMERLDRWLMGQCENKKLNNILCPCIINLIIQGLLSAGTKFSSLIIL